ncbi:DgyrCDS2720 [Dimorphilus gyrociliatus]|uniref:DgyrCDS2720 n=1 Tax=Dimorphilus gyrociliatus TaxID=2664684 RepID=A0A7I8VB41_9ANNE|nr:DgyrCDS2720 [Dimorphilus gyrociliatus]
MGYTRVIQVANLSPSVTREHMRNLFYPIGRISDMKLFPERDNPVIPVATKILFIKFDSSETVSVALHLNNTVFLDRMIDVRAYEPGKIPDETTALQAANALMMSHQATMSHLPMREDEVMKTIINPNQKKREDQIARTVVASNLPDVSIDQVMNFFSQAGDVKFLRAATGIDENGIEVRGAFIEYAALNSVSVALSLNSAFFEKETIM